MTVAYASRNVIRMATTLTRTAMQAVKGRMELIGMTQAELARHLDVRQPTISRWLNGQGVPTLDDFAHIAKALVIAPEKLLKGRTK